MGTTITRLSRSFPPDSVWARRAASISRGIALNVSIETGPGARRTALHRQGGFELQQVLVHHVGSGINVQWEIGQRDRVGHRSALDAVEDLLAQRLVQGAEHEVVRLGDAHLLGCLAEVRLVAWDRAVNPQLPENPLRPHVVRRLGLDQLRGPPSPEHRATAQAVGEAGEADGHVRPPRKTPHLGPGHPGVSRRGRRRSQTEAGQVLDVLAKDVGPGVEDQDAMVAAAIARRRAWSASAEPKDPPPMMMMSNGRPSTPDVLAIASSSPLQT